MKLDEYLTQVKQRADEAKKLYSNYGSENLTIVQANYNMSQKYVDDVPRLLAIIEVIREALEQVDEDGMLVGDESTYSWRWKSDEIVSGK